MIPCLLWFLWWTAKGCATTSTVDVSVPWHCLPDTNGNFYHVCPVDLIYISWIPYGLLLFKSNFHPWYDKINTVSLKKKTWNHTIYNIIVRVQNSCSVFLEGRILNKYINNSYMCAYDAAHFYLVQLRLHEKFSFNKRNRVWNFLFR